MTEAIILNGDCREMLRTLESGSVRTCVTSPPYFGLRDYGHDGQIGLEQTPEAYVAELVEVFREVRRVLSDDGTLWLNLGDSYFAKPKSNYDGKSPGLQSRNYGTGDTTLGYKQQAEKFKSLIAQGYKNKDLIGIPWRVAFALQQDGWYLRSDIIWHKPNPMPESVTDRPTKSHEYLFLLTKSPRYYYDHVAVREPSVTGAWDAMPPIGGTKHVDGNENNTYSGNTPASDGLRNRRDVWSIATKPFKGAHFAVMPEALVEPCVLAGSAEGDTVLDPFTGSGTVAVVALKHRRNFVGVELNPEYITIAKTRIAGVEPRML